MTRAYDRIEAGLKDAMAYAKADPGTVFPPRDEWDIAAYETDDVVQGYRDWRPDDPAPGPNHSPGYRWGWTNGRKDRTSKVDGYEDLRRAYFALSQRPN